VPPEQPTPIIKRASAAKTKSFLSMPFPPFPESNVMLFDEN
jgi:hypothetical protein